MDFTSDNMSIISTNFAVDKNGYIRATGGTIGGFILGQTNFNGNLDGIYDYNEYDLRGIMCRLMDYIGNDTTLDNIWNATGDSSLDSVDLMKIRRILNGTDTNTKEVKGTFSINTTNPKNCISIERNGTLAVSIGLGGINANMLNTKNLLCGNVSGNYFNGIAINGIIPQLSMVKNNNVVAKLDQNGNITCVSLTQTSKAEIKRNFEKLENALDIVKETDIYKYNLKTQEEESKKHIGIVIGDDFNYREEITSENNDGADTYSMVSVLWKAVQEQQEQIQEQHEQIEQLKEEIKELKGEK